MFVLYKRTKEEFIEEGLDKIHEDDIVAIKGDANGDGACFYAMGVYVRDFSELGDLDLKYLSLNGGVLTSKELAPLRLESTDSRGHSLLQFSNNGVYLGALGFCGINTPYFRTTEGVERYLLHSGNLSSFKLSQLTDDVVSGKYLSLSGGVLEAASTRVLTINRINGVNSLIYFKGLADGVTADFGYLGFNGIDSPIFYSAAGDTHNLLHSNNYSDYALPITGGTITGDLTLYNGGGNANSPAINFLRGTYDDTYYDWSILDNGGDLYFIQDVGSSTKTIALFYEGGLKIAGDITASSFTGNLTGNVTGGVTFDSKRGINVKYSDNREYNAFVLTESGELVIGYGTSLGKGSATQILGKQIWFKAAGDNDVTLMLNADHSASFTGNVTAPKFIGEASTVADGAVTLAKVSDDVKASLAKADASASLVYVNTELGKKATLVDGKIAPSDLPDFVLGQVIYGGIITYTQPDYMLISPSGYFTSKYGKEGFEMVDEMVKIYAQSSDGGQNDYRKFEGVYFIANVETASGFDNGRLPFHVGDWIISNGSSWEKVDNTDAVTSVAGLTGNVTVTSIANALTNAGYNFAINSFTNDEKAKLMGIEDGAQKNVQSDWRAGEGDAAILNKPWTLEGYGITDAYTKKQTDDKFLTLEGGTITSAAQIPLQIDSSNQSLNAIVFSRGTDALSYFGYSTTYGTRIYDYKTSSWLSIKDGNAYFCGDTILHAGNYSDLLADGTINGSLTATSFIGNLTGNAGSATKLATARTIWGQSFDGTGNILGSLTGVDILRYKEGGSGLYLRGSWYSSQLSDSDIGFEAETAAFLGKVAIGRTTADEKLHVQGNARIEGDIVATGKIKSTSAHIGAYEEVSMTDNYGAIEPNKFYKWGIVEGLFSVKLDTSKSQAGVTNEYLFQFTAGNGISFDIDSSDYGYIKWGNYMPTQIIMNMTYQVSILDGYASIIEYSAS